MLLKKFKKKNRYKVMTYAVPDEQRIKDIVNKYFKGESPTSAELNELTDLSEEELVKFFITIPSTTPMSNEIIKVGDISKIKFNFKVKNVKIKKRKSYISDVSDGSDSDMENSLEKDRYNYASKTLTIYLACIEKDKELSVVQILEGLKSKIYDDYIQHCQNSDILLENIQINRVFPTARRTGATSLGVLTSGRLQPDLHPTSNRAFVLNLASPFLIGNKDDHSIRIPFLSKNLINTRAVEHPRSPSRNIIHDLCSLMGETIIIKGVRDEIIKFKLVLCTSRLDVPIKYPFVSFVSPTGFMKNALTSAFPSALPAGPPENGLLPLISGNLSNSNVSSAQTGAQPPISASPQTQPSISASPQTQLPTGTVAAGQADQASQTASNPVTRLQHRQTYGLRNSAQGTNRNRGGNNK